MNTKDWSKATDEEIRVRVAELLGWQVTRNNEIFTLASPKNPEFFSSLEPINVLAFIPSYPADLNVCAEMEKTLGGFHGCPLTGEVFDYFDHLITICVVEKTFVGFATARQRCIAFITTKEGR